MKKFMKNVVIKKDDNGMFMMNKKGITLIALVITTVVLIILAAVAIGYVAGQNGLLNRTKYAKDEYLVKANEEQAELAIAGTLKSTRDTVQSSVPAGTIISYMGNNAPTGYLACDGTEYNIADYQTLADQINTEFGSYNKFGGDGVTTFKVPNLQGEFLRGTGTNADTSQGNGSAVGDHQKATQQVSTYNDPNNKNIVFDATNSGTYASASYVDKNIAGNFNTRGAKYLGFNIDANNKGMSKMFTARPTNTSVLYCIKY